MNFLNASKVPRREDRLPTNTAFAGPCGKLKNDCFKRCLRQGNRKFNQTEGCQHMLTFGMVGSLRNTVIILHSPLGCGSFLLNTSAMSKQLRILRDPNSERLIYLSTNLDDSNVIGGGEQNLREAILYAEKEFRPEAIIIPVACVPALIGDDVDSVVSDLQKQVSASLVPLYCEGFRTKIPATAYDAVFHGYLKYLAKPPERHKNTLDDGYTDYIERQKISRTVNISNVESQSYGDNVELKRLLNALGLNVNLIPVYAEPSNFKHEIFETALNVSFCGTHDNYFLKHMEEIYGIPYIIDTMPVGKRNTARWIRKIAAFFGLESEAEKLIEAEEKQLDEALKPYIEYFKGKKAYLVVGDVRVLTTAEAFQNLGFEIVGMKAYHIDEYAVPALDAVEKVDEIPINVAMGHTFEITNVVKRVKPDIFVTHPGGQNTTARYGIPIYPAFGPGIYNGYAGLFSIARGVKRALENGQYNKLLAKHKRLPYTKEWYEKDPAYYITELDDPEK